MSVVSSNYLDCFQKYDLKIRKQFTQENIKIPEKKYSLDDLLNLENVLTPNDKNFFEKILKFKSKMNEDSSEYALAWLLNAKPCGGKQKRADIVLDNGEKISIKSYQRKGERSIRDIKFGRVESSKSYKKVMSLWSFYISFLSEQKKNLSSTRMSKNDILNINPEIGKFITPFLKNSINLISCNENNNIKKIMFLKKILQNTENIKDEIVVLINSLFKEVVNDDKVDHLVMFNKLDKRVKLLKNISDDHYVDDFFNKNFKLIAGTELWIEVV